MDGRSAGWVHVAEGREFLRASDDLAWPPAPPERRPRHALLLADPEGRLAPGDLEDFARQALLAGCCWFEIWGPRAHEMEAAVDAVRDAPDPPRPPADEEEDHIVMTASSTPEEAALADAVRMVLCAACSTEGHDADRTSRLFVLASGDDRFADGIERWLRDPDSIP